MWSSALAFLRDEGNRAILGWLGGGLVALATGIWAVFVYFHPAPESKSSPPVKQIEADWGSIAVGGNVTGATITAGSSNECPKPGR